MSQLLLTWAATSAFADPRLSASAYVVEITGPLARIVVEQTWVNEGDVPIDGLYVFPLDGTLAVDAMELTVGDRHLVGEVLALQEATVAYQAAVANGQTAALTTQQRPDVFMQRVGNLRPGEVVQVRLSAIQPVSSVDGAYELSLPLVVGPRFVTARQWSDGAPMAPIAALTSPDLEARVEVALTSGVPVSDLSSPSHDMFVWASPRSADLVTTVPLDQDFVLRWTVPAKQPRAALYVQDGHALLTLDPPTGQPGASAALTDVDIDWGDWEVERPWPSALPDLQAGQPLLTGVRVLRRGTQPVVVRGQLAGGPWSVSLQPLDVPTGRSIPSTWARQVIAELEREAVADPSLAEEIVALSLEYQVLSRRSAFLVVDPAGVPFGEGSDDDGLVLSRDFLAKVPAGRSYQSAVQMSAGVVGGAANGNTYTLDGVGVSDGESLSSRHSEVIEVLSVAVGVSAPEGETVAYPAGPLPSALVPPQRYLPSGTNHLGAQLEIGHDERVGAPLTGDHASGVLSGPVVRDHLWAHAAFDGDRSRLGDRAYDGGRGALTLMAQPNAHHRLTAHGAVGRAALVDDDRYSRDEAGALGRWQWFLDPDANLDTQAGAALLDLDADAVGRQHARSVATVLDVRGSHDLTFGADADRTAAALGGGWTEAHVGDDLPDDVDLLRVGGFAEDSWRPWSRLTVLAGARVDGIFGRAHVGPRGSVAWDPFGDDKTRLAVSFGRRYGHLGLLSLVGEDGLSRQDGWLASAQRELFGDVAIGVEGDLRDQRGVPTVGGGRVGTRSVASTVFVRKVPGRRWSLSADWRRVHLLDGVPETRLDDGSLDAYRDVARGLVAWDLPTDPWTHTITLVGDVHSRPLGVVVPDPTTTDQPNAAYASVSLQLTQQVDVRTGRLYVRFEGRYLASLADDRDLSPWVVVSPTLTQADWDGTRLGAAVGYTF